MHRSVCAHSPPVIWHFIIYQTARSVEFSNHREQGSRGEIYMFRYRDVGETEEKLGGEYRRKRELTRLTLSTCLLSNMWRGNAVYKIIGTRSRRRLEELELKTFSSIDNDFIVASWKDNNNLIVPRFSIFQIDTWKFTIFTLLLPKKIFEIRSQCTFARIYSQSTWIRSIHPCTSKFRFLLIPSIEFKLIKSY